MYKNFLVSWSNIWLGGYSSENNGINECLKLVTMVITDGIHGNHW